MTDNNTVNNNSTNPDNSSTVFNDSQNGPKNANNDSHENQPETAIQDTNADPNICTDQSFDLSATTNEDTNKTDPKSNPNDQSKIENESLTETEKKIDGVDTSVPSVTNSNEPVPMDEGDEKTESTRTASLSLEKENSTTGESEQHVDNSSNVLTSSQTPHSILQSVSSKQQEEENTLPSHNDEATSIDDINLSFQPNNDQPGGDKNNQISGETDVQLMETNKLDTIEFDSIDNLDKNSDVEKRMNMDITLSSYNTPSGNLEHSYSTDQHSEPDSPFSNSGDNSFAAQVADSIRKYDDSSCQFQADKIWLNDQYHDEDHQYIKKPDEIENDMDEPPNEIDENILNRIQGSMIGMALGDALGAHVEFRPRKYLVANPVTDLESGGTWGLTKGQFTDDTSMALCLANSLIARRGFVPYDQLVRYKWWYNSGYMSSTGQCFDIGAATRQSVIEFERRQKQFAKSRGISLNKMDFLSNPEALKEFKVHCSEDEVAGNGALMRLTPVPLFFYRDPKIAVEYSGYSGQITHGDQKAYDACRYYGALIVAALLGYEKNVILDKEFYSKHKEWFDGKDLHPDIKSIAEGSYQKNGYDEGIRGKGYIVSALEAALWAFWSDEDSFEKGALAAVNLGDDTDTTAAIYGQLAGAYYGYQKLPEHWLKYVYAKKFMEKLSKWIAYEGEHWKKPDESSTSQ